MGSIRRTNAKRLNQFRIIFCRGTSEKMKLFRFVSLISLLVVLAFVKADEELYSDKYDYIDPKEIVENDRLRDQYYSCFMETSPCVTPDAIFFKCKLDYFEIHFLSLSLPLSLILILIENFVLSFVSLSFFFSFLFNIRR